MRSQLLLDSMALRMNNQIRAECFYATLTYSMSSSSTTLNESLGYMGRSMNEKVLLFNSETKL
eukprot:1590938-Amphidinium_carterae.1